MKYDILSGGKGVLSQKKKKEAVFICHGVVTGARTVIRQEQIAIAIQVRRTYELSLSLSHNSTAPLYFRVIDRREQFKRTNIIGFVAI